MTGTLSDSYILLLNMTGQQEQQQPVSCIPLWVLEDLKNYLKKSTHRRRSHSIACQNNNLSPLQQRRRLRSEERWCGRPLKVALLGADKVGKSALTVRYLTKRFIGEYRSDSGEFSTVQSYIRLENIKQLDKVSLFFLISNIRR